MAPWVLVPWLRWLSSWSTAPCWATSNSSDRTHERDRRCIYPTNDTFQRGLGPSSRCHRGDRRFATLPKGRLNERARFWRGQISALLRGGARGRGSAGG